MFFFWGGVDVIHTVDQQYQIVFYKIQPQGVSRMRVPIPKVDDNLKELFSLQCIRSDYAVQLVEL